MEQVAAFRDRYGPWSVVLGASEGLGEAYAREAARRGLNVVVAARRAAPLSAVARSLHEEHGVDAVPIVIDLKAGDCLEALGAVTEALEVGLVVYNGAGSFVGPFLEEEPGHALEQVAINVSTLIGVCERFGRPMVERGRGGIIVMSSGAGVAGTAGLAVYSATKAFQLTLAQALHEEWRRRGVDVLGVVGPAIDTPNFRRSFDHDPDALPHEPLAPADVAREVIDALGREMEIMPGAPNREGYRVLSTMSRIEQARMLSAAFTAASRPPDPARDPD